MPNELPKDICTRSTRQPLIKQESVENSLRFLGWLKEIIKGLPGSATDSGSAFEGKRLFISRAIFLTVSKEKLQGRTMGT